MGPPDSTVSEHCCVLNTAQLQVRGRGLGRKLVDRWLMLTAVHVCARLTIAAEVYQIAIRGFARVPHSLLTSALLTCCLLASRVTQPRDFA